MADPRISRFEALYRDQFAFVWAAARALGSHESSVPDVVQEVFITAYRHLDGIDPEVSPRPWLYAVARRVVFRLRRTSARTARREVALRRLPDDVALPHAAGDAAVDLSRLLDALDPTQREVLVMSDLLGMSGPEMATQIGAPLDTVYSRLRLARGRVQRLARASTIEAVGAELRRVPDEARARCWLAIAPSLGGVASTVATAGAVKLGLVATAAITTVVWFAAPRGDVAAPPTTQQSHATAIDDGPAVRHGDAARRDAAVATMPDRPPLDTAIADSPIVASTPPDAAPRVEPSSSAPRPNVAAAPESIVDAPQPGIDAELAVLERAEAQIRANDPAGALAILDSTRSIDPNRQLGDAREALRVRALCAAGRTAEAQAAAEALRAARPGSRIAATTKCEAQ